MENVNLVIGKLEGEIKSLFSLDSSGHDLYHLKRVLDLSLNIQKREGGDKLVIAAAAFLHDVHRIMQNETGEYCHPKDSLPKIKEILKTINIAPDVEEKVLHCVEFHEEYGFSEKGRTVKDIETLILQDADNLDAMGAIGIARAFSFGGSKGRPIYLPEIPINTKLYNDIVLGESDIHHFYSKLLRLENNMNTKTAKKRRERDINLWNYF
jgi:uncharacterized protein